MTFPHRRLIVSGLAAVLTTPVLATPAIAKGGAVKVAVAANFTGTARALAAAFETRSGHKVVHSFGASGQFYTQIVNGAPFEVFLSADAERPLRLEREGRIVPGSRVVYAYGKLVLWSAGRIVDAGGAVLSQGRFGKLAIAEPAAAPYGTAAVETLKHMGLYERLAPRLVRGGNISQAHAFVATGAAELGFVALSQVQKAGGSRWIVPQSHYTPIDQQAVLLKAGAGNPAARAYMAFLKSPDAARIIRAYGYEVR